MADLAVVAANVLKSANGQHSYKLSAEAILAGEVVYELAAGTLGLADSNGVSPANSVAGLACNSAPGAGQPVAYCALDTAFATGIAGLTSGAVIYLSNTPGKMTSTYSEVASGSTVNILGVVNTGGTLNLKPAVGGVK